MLKLEKSNFPEVAVCNPEGKIEVIINNEFELYQIRLQIVQQKVEGYYLEYNGGKRINIEKYGILSEYPEEIDESTHLLSAILKAQMKWRLDERENK